MHARLLMEPSTVEPTLVKQWDGVIRKPEYRHVKTNADADAAYEELMAGKPYGAHGHVVERDEHRYFENARADYINFYVSGDVHGHTHVQLHGRAMMHLLERTDIDAGLRRELQSGLGFFRAIAPEACWGPEGVPALPPRTQAASPKSGTAPA